MQRYDVVIVGGGHAGAQAAIALRQGGYAGSIALLSAELEAPYERPPLSKDYLAGEKSFDRLLLRPATFWAEREIALLTGREAVAVDPDAHEVATADGARIGYGKLVWAAGGAPRRLSCAGHDLAGVHSVRTRADVDRMIAELPAVEQVVVIAGGGHAADRFAVKRVVERADPVDMRAQPRDQRVAVGHAIEGGDIVERLGLFGQAVRLLIVDHLQPMFDGAEQAIGVGQFARFPFPDHPRTAQRRQRIERCGRAQRGIAAAVDQLMDLRVEFDLTNAAPPALEIIAETEFLPLRMMIADAVRHRADFGDRPEIERAAPHERADRIEEALSERNIARRGARADEGGPLPRQGGRLIMAERGFVGERHRGRLRRGAQAQVDAEDIAVAVARLEQINDALGDPHRRLDRLLSRPAREDFGIEDQDRIDVRRIIEFAAAMLAQRQCSEADRIGIGRAFRNRDADRIVERVIGEVGQPADHLLQRRATQIGNRDAQCHRLPLPPQCARRVSRIDGDALRTDHRVDTIPRNRFDDLGPLPGDHAQERRMPVDPRKQRIEGGGRQAGSHDRFRYALRRNAQPARNPCVIQDMTSSDAYRPRNGTLRPPQNIAAPATHEGVGNALRAAYGQTAPIPEDWRKLLSRLDR